MNSPAVDSYLDELLAETAAIAPAPAAPGRAAHGPALPDCPSLPALAPAPAVAPVTPPIASMVPAAPVAATPAGPLPASPPASPTSAMPVAIGVGPSRLIANTSRWLRVSIGEDHYALELLRVQEVVRMAPIVAMRGADRALLGVMNLRGRIVPVFDLGRWLGNAADVAISERARIVVVERDDELIGVLVADVEEVASLGREHIEPPLLGSAPGAIVGIARVDDTPTVLLDANALFE